MFRWTLLLLIGLLTVPSFAFAQDEVEEAESTEAEAEAEPAESAGPSAPGPAATPSGGEDAEMSVYRELKTVESEVNDLKEKVFRSKARLLLLEEKVIRGVVSGAKAVITHVNELGPAYKLESITYYFDGNAIYTKTDPSGGLAKEKEIEIFEANIPPGNHTLSITGVVRGNGSGLFAYLKDYTFNISSTYTFLAQDGKTTRLDAALVKQGGPLGDYAKGPVYDYRLLGGAVEAEQGEAAE